MGSTIFRRVLLLGSTLVTVSLGAGFAMAQDTASQTPAMLLGVETHAPPGFLDMCRRSPQDCSPQRLTPDESADASRAFSRLYWRAVFARPVEAPAAAADPPGQDSYSGGHRPAGPGADWLKPGSCFPGCLETPL